MAERCGVQDVCPYVRFLLGAIAASGHPRRRPAVYAAEMREQRVMPAEEAARQVLPTR